MVDWNDAVSSAKSLFGSASNKINSVIAERGEHKENAKAVLEGSAEKVGNALKDSAQWAAKRSQVIYTKLPSRSAVMGSLKRGLRDVAQHAVKTVGSGVAGWRGKGLVRPKTAAILPDGFTEKSRKISAEIELDCLGGKKVTVRLTNSKLLEGGQTNIRFCQMEGKKYVMAVGKNSMHSEGLDQRVYKSVEEIPEEAMEALGAIPHLLKTLRDEGCAYVPEIPAVAFAQVDENLFPVTLMERCEAAPLANASPKVRDAFYSKLVTNCKDLWSRGITHGDLSSANVMQRDSQPVLIDWDTKHCVGPKRLLATGEALKKAVKSITTAGTSLYLPNCYTAVMIKADRMLPDQGGASAAQETRVTELVRMAVEAKDKFGLAVVLLRAYSGLSEEELSSEVVDEGKSPNYDKKMKAYRKIFQICEGKKEMPQDVTEAILDGLAAAQTLDVTYEHWQENERKYK